MGRRCERLAQDSKNKRRPEFPGAPSFAVVLHAKGGGLDAAAIAA
jgi:hypothetical protein